MIGHRVVGMFRVLPFGPAVDDDLNGLPLVVVEQVVDSAGAPGADVRPAPTHPPHHEREHAANDDPDERVEH